MLIDLPESLCETYDRTVKRIPKSDLPLIGRALEWLAFPGMHLLRPPELAIAVAFGPEEDPSSNEENMIENPAGVFAMCGSFLVVIEEKLKLAMARLCKQSHSAWIIQ
jgi:hypothetical protein